ncbi:hypothetical protein LIER_20349 [Lithospermum erythrorhizon]|uniref:Uncharacterized protein n=1 Tax=Lithospermum erythrorhizon TaxID=34254 RepID=A0AAV3QM42_LITER
MGSRGKPGLLTGTSIGSSSRMLSRTRFVPSSLLFPPPWSMKTPEVAMGLKKLEEGFLETLALDVFCDPDVLIKAGLSRGHDSFPDVDLGTSRSLFPSFIRHFSFHSPSF